MRNLSFAIVDGNLINDPEVVSTRTGKVVATFPIACNHDERFEKKNVSYFTIECWDRVAENCATYLKKGSKVTVQGSSLRQDRWKDAEGKSHNRIKIIASNIRFDATGRKEYSDIIDDDQFIEEKKN